MIAYLHDFTWEDSEEYEVSPRCRAEPESARAVLESKRNRTGREKLAEAARFRRHNGLAKTMNGPTSVRRQSVGRQARRRRERN